MSRAERLLQLMQALRGRRLAVTGAVLAAELGISLRTLYRDIASLQKQGAEIESEPGLGYRLKPGFVLPPLMFKAEEIEALVLGARWVAARTDSVLALAAQRALSKIAGILPTDLRHELDSTALFIGPSANGNDSSVHIDSALTQVRAAIRAERKLQVQYRDGEERMSERILWPFALGFFDSTRILMAWCELRQNFRHFRIDRLLQITTLEVRYDQRRQNLLRSWRQQQGLATQDNRVLPHR